MSVSESSASSSTSSSPASSPPPSSVRKRKRLDAQVSDEPEGAPNLLDEPTPLSHAEKRRQKKGKTSKPAIPQSPGVSATETISGAQNHDAEARTAKLPRQNSIWVGNLSFKTTPDALRAFFDGAGEITRVMMPMKPAPVVPGKWKDAQPTTKVENKGFAYVDFATPDGQIVAITMSEGHLDGRRLLIKAGDNYEGRPKPAITEAQDGTPAAWRTKFAKKVLAAQKQPAAPTLFLGNLGFETTETSIKEMLNAHRRQTSKTKPANSEEVADEGQVAAETKKEEYWIRQIRLGTFEDSGKCKGWAFVDFTTKENATDALVNPHNYHLDGRDIKLEFASADAVRRGGVKPAKPVPQPIRRVANPDPKAKYNNKKTRQAERLHTNDMATSPIKNAREAVDEDSRPEKRQRVASDQALHEKSAPTATRDYVKASRLPKDKVNKGFGARERVRPRPTPGAALALAKRESSAIVPSEGKKIKF